MDVFEEHTWMYSQSSQNGVNYPFWVLDECADKGKLKIPADKTNAQAIIRHPTSPYC